MMQFRLAKESIVKLLGKAAGDRYGVIGFTKQKDASEVLDDLRVVQVYYSSSDFPRISRSSIQHDVVIKIELTASTATKIDLSALNDPEATDNERSIALAESKSAAENIQDVMDEFFEIIYQVIMDGRNLDLGLPPGSVANRWISSIQKDPVPYPNGQYICLSGLITLNFRVSEELTGDVGIAQGDGTIDVTVDIVNDDTEKTGVETPLGG